MSSQGSLDKLKISFPPELISALKDEESGQGAELPRDLETLTKALPPQMPIDDSTEQMKDSSESAG